MGSTKQLTKAQQELITKELISYADTMARQYQGCGLEIEDLQQEARYGLCQAVLHFNAEAGASLKAFSTFYIRKYCIRSIELYGSTIRLSREDRSITQISSLDVELSEDGDSGADYLECVDDSWEEQERREKVMDMLSALTPKEREAIEYLFGLEDTALTLRQTSRILKVTPTALRAIYEKALLKMRASMQITEF